MSTLSLEVRKRKKENVCQPSLVLWHLKVHFLLGTAHLETYQLEKLVTL